MANFEDTPGLPELLKKAGSALDPSIFEQILEMDDEDETREFSQQLVLGFFEQAQETFTEMESAIQDKDLKTLSEKGHFLKGSSATLGLTKVKDACEKIQHFGAQKDENGNESEKFKDVDVCLQRIRDIIPGMKKDYDEIKGYLMEFYGE